MALEERAVPHRVVGEAAFFQRAEVRDVLAWLRLLADPTDAAAVVRALARPPIELRSVDIARCTQIARRRKLDMVARARGRDGVAAGAAGGPRADPRFPELYRAGVGALDSTRPDLFVHRLIDRLGLRRQQLFAAQADVVERLRALARFGELASAYARRSPQATAREFARYDRRGRGLRPARGGGAGPRRAGRRSRSWRSTAPAGSRPSTCTCSGSTPGCRRRVAASAVADVIAARARCRDGVAEVAADGARAARPGAVRGDESRAPEGRARVPSANDRSAALGPPPLVEPCAERWPARGRTREEEMFGPAETLHSTYRLLRDEVLEGTMRAGGRLAELRLDTDLDVSHAVVRYLELLKLAALIERPEGQSLAEAVRDVNSRILQAVTAEQREIFTSSALDDYLLDAERDARRRAAAVVARDDPSVESFLPTRGDGVVLSASDIDTYRTCPLKYKFARVFRIPQEPTINQRFGIVVHQVLERFHAGSGQGGAVSGHWPRCWGCSTRAGGAVGSASPRRSASYGARPFRR